ncbi:MAG: 2-hydroxychromene-2-carboxylate isomerase [Pseudomonadota bacterium]
MSPAPPIDFYFDFSSPYAYLAQFGIDRAAAAVGRTFRWRPFLLGAAFKLTGAAPLMTVPVKGEYARRDLSRRARALGLPFAPGTPFPFLALGPCRGFYILDDADPAQAKRWAQRMFTAFFGEGATIDTASAAVAAAGAWCAEEGVDSAALEARMADVVVKDRLKRETATAIDRGVFGAPFFIVDGEPFWGFDAVEDAMRWAASGGW